MLKHEVTCSLFFKVYNVVPSISAVTGISPGRYVWRIAVAVHLGPRALVLSAYYHFLLALSGRAADDKGSGGDGGKTVDRLRRAMTALFWLQMAEIVGLCGISFVHNREHYREFITNIYCILLVNKISAPLVVRLVSC